MREVEWRARSCRLWVLRDRVFVGAAYVLLLTALGLVLVPLISVIALSVGVIGPGMRWAAPDLRWYVSAAREFRSEVWINTWIVSIPVGVTGTMGGLLISLNFWRPRMLMSLLFASFCIASLPSAVHATAVAHAFKLLGMHESSLSVLVAADCIWVLPFCSIIILAAIGQVRESHLCAGMEISGAKERIVLTRLILRPILPALFSSFLVAVLLTSNEYVRAAYMSGSAQLLSKYIYGKMQSGADPTVYALAGVNIFAALVVIVVMYFGFWLSRRFWE